ncbi:hypothetical protein [Labedaea rhizosphaerae]|uniref:Uncharacterized protein n=1 Tax=Labedaea rhizosphaerae TaxID=598644 RepID=A0A4R6S9W5_LABRH|nr:hypothetical protein [Labedaea rhizosphaerae]TDP96690.1 hypothetical protein EV186_104678 [Labedaea rhizosphaerae]
MNDYLRIYLNDQLALGTAWRELARRSTKANQGSDVGTALGKVATAIAEDVATFRAIMRSLGVPENPVKSGAAVLGERLGRLKLNGKLRSYSMLSRFEELEFLTMGIDGKKQLWGTLRDLAGLAERLPDVDFDHLIARAQQQRDELEPFRVRAGQAALAGA